MSTEDYMSDAERTAYADSGRASTHAERAALYEQARQVTQVVSCKICGTELSGAYGEAELNWMHDDGNDYDHEPVAQTQDDSEPDTVTNRLEYLRTELRAERISTAELVELRTLVPHIAPGDTELLEAAGVPENELLCDGCGHAINPDTDYHTPEDEAYHPDCCPECKISVHIIHKSSDWLRE